MVSEFVDDLLSASPIPIAIVRRARNLDRPLPGVFSRALVPVTGSPASRAAQEMAFNLSANLGTEVVLVHVVSRSPAVARVPFVVAAGEEFVPGVETIAQRLLGEAAAWGEGLCARVRTETRTGASAGDEIISAAADLESDLVVMGATVRRLSGRPFLGHAVEQVLADADPTVGVVTVPPGWGEAAL